MKYIFLNLFHCLLHWSILLVWGMYIKSRTCSFPWVSITFSSLLVPHGEFFVYIFSIENWRFCIVRIFYRENGGQVLFLIQLNWSNSKQAWCQSNWVALGSSQLLSVSHRAAARTSGSGNLWVSCSSVALNLDPVARCFSCSAWSSLIEIAMLEATAMGFWWCVLPGDWAWEGTDWRCSGA